MECAACKYKHNRDPMVEDGVYKGDAPFIPLSGHGINYKDNYDRPYTHYSTVVADLFACPKCGTVRVEL